MPYSAIVVVLGLLCKCFLILVTTIVVFGYQPVLRYYLQQRRNQRILRNFKMTTDSLAINLLRGWPCPTLLPHGLIEKAATAVLRNPSLYTPALLYGPDPGYEPLRESIAAWLNSFFQPTAGDVTSKRICITGGASQNLGCILNVFTDPEYTRNIWIVDPA